MPEMPGTLPLEEFCQKVQWSQELATLGQETPQLATQRVYLPRPPGAPNCDHQPGAV